MRQLLLTFLFSSLLCGWLPAQERNHYERFADRLYFGGSLGLVFGNRVTQVDIMPMGGIWIFPQWTIGAGGRYTYRKDRFDLVGGRMESQSTNIWGVSAFTQLLPVPDFNKTFGIDLHGGVVFHAEYEGLYVDTKFFDATSTSGTGWINMYLVGGGWHQRVGRRAAINFLVLWDLTNNRFSPYSSNPILRFNITF